MRRKEKARKQNRQRTYRARSVVSCAKPSVSSKTSNIGNKTTTAMKNRATHFAISGMRKHTREMKPRATILSGSSGFQVYWDTGDGVVPPPLADRVTRIEDVINGISAPPGWHWSDDSARPCPALWNQRELQLAVLALARRSRGALEGILRSHLCTNVESTSTICRQYGN